MSITPNSTWQGEGSLGCGIGYGYLHRIPVRVRSATKPLPALSQPSVQNHQTFTVDSSSVTNSLPTFTMNAMAASDSQFPSTNPSHPHPALLEGTTTIVNSTSHLFPGPPRSGVESTATESGVLPFHSQDRNHPYNKLLFTSTQHSWNACDCSSVASWNASYHRKCNSSLLHSGRISSDFRGPAALYVSNEHSCNSLTLVLTNSHFYFLLVIIFMEIIY